MNTPKFTPKQETHCMACGSKTIVLHGLEANAPRMYEALKESLRAQKLAVERLLPTYVAFPLTGQLGQVVAAHQESIANIEQILSDIEKG